MSRRPVYRPPFTLTPALLSPSAEISRLVGRIEGLPTSTPQVKLRRKNRVRTVQATLAIEGGLLEEPQVTAIFDGQRVLGSRAEIREVKNAIAAYDRVPALGPGVVSDLLLAHGVMMRDLVSDAGRFRKGGVGVVGGGRVAHMAPPPSRVPHLVSDLLDFVARDHEVHPLIKAAVAHYELELIHPFTDGNGRMGRLWQHRILLDVHPVFAHVPVESVVRARQSDYYASLSESDRAGNASPFVVFSLTATRDALKDLIAELRPEPATFASRLERARAHFATAEFSRADYSRLFPNMSSATASRDLRAGVDGELLVRRGEKATARYAYAKRSRKRGSVST